MQITCRYIIMNEVCCMSFLRRREPSGVPQPMGCPFSQGRQYNVLTRMTTNYPTFETGDAKGKSWGAKNPWDP